MTHNGVLTMFSVGGATIALLLISPKGRALAERVALVERLSAARGAPPVLAR